MNLVTGGRSPARRDIHAPAQLVGAHLEVFGNPRDVLIRGIDDLPAENPREGGLRHTGTAMKLRGGDSITIQQLS